MALIRLLLLLLPLWCNLVACSLSKNQKKETLHKLQELINDETLESLFDVLKIQDVANHVDGKKEAAKTVIKDNIKIKSVEKDAQAIETGEEEREGSYQCADHVSLGGDNCQQWKQVGLCKEKAFRNQMRQFCQKTCDLCKPPAPPIPDIPSCALTEHGCCWDKKTAAVDKNQEGCLPCKDKYKFLCKNFATDCTSKLEKGIFMRLSCPETCQVDCDSNLNVHKCKDDKANLQNCIDWARNGACKKSPEKMKAYCKYTCGFCTGAPQATGG